MRSSTGLVVGQNADGTWLQSEHQNRPGWIFAALTDIAAEGIGELPAEALPETAVVGATPEPTVAPTPEPAPAVPDSIVATATGTVVNVAPRPRYRLPDGRTGARRLPGPMGEPHFRQRVLDVRGSE